MQLSRDLHLAYCTNIHRGETWPETLHNLETHVLAVRDEVWPEQPYAIGLRLGAAAVAGLMAPGELERFRCWLKQHRCYVFTINGFPYGPFHGTRVKEQVYLPDWRDRQRLDYTLRLFDVLAALVPEGVEGGVSTVPGSFKAWVQTESDWEAMVTHLWESVDYLAQLRDRTGRLLHLDLEPEPLCAVETSVETVGLFERVSAARPGDERWRDHLRVNYDACHLAVEFEEPHEVVRRFQQHGIRLGKIHLSAALKVKPSETTVRGLAEFQDSVYLHQVVIRRGQEGLQRYADLPEALGQWQAAAAGSGEEEWRIHYHVPLYSPPAPLWETTADHLLGLLDRLAEDPTLCGHLEMETYTWEVLPAALRQHDVTAQLVAEHRWTLDQLAQRGLAPAQWALPGAAAGGLP